MGTRSVVLVFDVTLAVAVVGVGGGGGAGHLSCSSARVQDTGRAE